MATVQSYAGYLGLGNTIPTSYLNTASKVYMGTNESPYLDLASHDHGLIGGVIATGECNGTTSNRQAVSDLSSSAVSSGGITVGNNTIAYDGSYIAPLIGHTAKDDFTNYFYSIYNTSTYTNSTINIGSAADRTNTTIMDSNTFVNTGRIVWNSSQSSSSDITSGTATDIRDTTCIYDRYWGMYQLTASGYTGITNTYSTMEALNTANDINALAYGLLGGVPGSVTFGFGYADYIQTAGGYDQNFNYWIMSGMYAYRLDYEKYSPTKFLYSIGAAGLLTLSYDQASKDRYTLTDLQTGQGSVYQSLHKLGLSGITGNFFANGRQLSNEDMDTALANGETLTFYGLGRVKNPTSGTISADLNYVVYNNTIFNRMANNFVRGFDYNGAITRGEQAAQTIEDNPFATGIVNSYDRLGYRLQQADRNGLESTIEDRLGFDSLYYNDKRVSPAPQDNLLLSWNPYIGITGNLPASGNINAGATKIGHNYLVGIDTVFGLDEDSNTNGQFKVSAAYRPIANQTWCSAIGAASEVSYMQNPFGQNAFYLVSGINWNNYFRVLSDFSFGVDVGSVSATGLNSYSDLKNSVMQVWTASTSFKYRPNSSWAIDLLLGYAGLNAYYDSPGLNYFNPGFATSDHFADRFYGRLGVTNYDVDRRGSLTIFTEGSYILNNAADNGNTTTFGVGAVVNKQDYSVNFSLGGEKTIGGLTGTNNKTEAKASIGMTYRF
jgi:hypothetical protein